MIFLEIDTLYAIRVRASNLFATTESLPIIIFTGNTSSLQLTPPTVSDICPSPTVNDTKCPSSTDSLSEGAVAMIIVFGVAILLLLFVILLVCGCYFAKSKTKRYVSVVK